MRQLVVTDANIFIDLFKVKFVDHLFKIGCEIWTSRLVLEELYGDQKLALLDYEREGLLVIAREVLLDDSLFFSSRFSAEEISLLQLAYAKNAILLSGERMMVKWCDRHQLETHGLLWVLDQFILNDCIKESVAATGLEILLQINQWLPMKLCIERIEEWRKGQH